MFGGCGGGGSAIVKARRAACETGHQVGEKLKATDIKSNKIGVISRCAARRRRDWKVFNIMVVYIESLTRHYTILPVHHNR